MVEKRIIALTGLSGAGKTTFGDYIEKKMQFSVPQHTTTRKRRYDDKLGFYEYVSHDKFNDYNKNGEFLFWSGDSKYIDKENGNFYGVLKRNVDVAFEKSSTIILYISYKDLAQLTQLSSKLGYALNVINFSFHNIDKGITSRLKSRGTNTEEEIEKRIKYAKESQKIYDKFIMDFKHDKSNILSSVHTIYTDDKSIEKVREEALAYLKL